MTTEYLSHFGLTHSPFAKEIADTDLWLPPSKQEVVSGLEQAVNEHASGLVIGEPGVGKTCTLRAVRHRLAKPGFRLTYCHNSTLGRRDFYRQLCLAMGLSPSATAASVFWAVSNHINELGREHTHPVLILDEAHLLHQDTLDHLHILLNYEWDSQPLLSIILVGLPELEHRLHLRRNRPLYSRLFCRYHIEPLTHDDTGIYVRMRMTNAGCDHEVFASDAIAMLHEAATGALRDIDRIATSALRLAAGKKRKLVERDIVTSAVCLGQPEGAAL